MENRKTRLCFSFFIRSWIYCAATATKEVIWLRRLLEELGFKQLEPTVINIDNDGARELANNQMISQRTKHIDIRHHFIRECIESNQVKLKACTSKVNTADVFTKALPRPKFIECQNEMGVMQIIT